MIDLPQRHHFWNVPATVVGVPPPTTVVVVSNCGHKINLPAWQVLEWQAKANPVPAPEQTCPACLDVQTALQSTESN